MTPKQKRVLDFITDYFEQHSYSPSYDEIGAALGMAKSSTHRMIACLIKEDKLARNGRGARCVVPKSAVVNTCVPLVLDTLERALEDFDNRLITADGVVLRMRPLPGMLRSGA